MVTVFSPPSTSATYDANGISFAPPIGSITPIEAAGQAPPSLSLPEDSLAPTHADVSLPALCIRALKTSSASETRSGWLGYGAALLGHSILLVGLLFYVGSTGAPHQYTEETLEVDIIVEPPGAAPGETSSAIPKASAPTLSVETPTTFTDDPIVNEIAPEAVRPELEAETGPNPDLNAEAAPEPRSEPIAEPKTQHLEMPAAKEEPEPKAEPIEGRPPLVKFKPHAPKQRQTSAPQLDETAKKSTAVRASPSPRKPQAAASGLVGARGKSTMAGQSSANIDAFRAAVAARLARNRPSTEVAAMAQGVVVVTFGIASSGAAEGIRIARSSGHAILDGAALSSVRRASPFPAPPPGAPRSFTVPMRFNLR